MQYTDLRTFLARVEQIGELKRLRGAHWDLEIGALCKLFREKPNAPALLFDEITGYPAGYRVAVNPLDSLPRLCLTLGMRLDYRPIEFVRAWKERLQSIRPLAPRVVREGPVLENVHTGGEIDLYEFPVPRWNELDGGRYIGTGCAFITRDPDKGWVNLGTYRVVIHDKDTLGFFIAPGRHGRIQMEKYLAQRKNCPVLISVGHDPLVSFAASTDVPFEMCEYDYMGWIRDEPVDVVLGEFTGLPMPATAEIVLEGQIVHDERRVEGPFAEYTGYFGSSPRPEPMVKVQAIYHRDDPIIMGMPVYRNLAGNRGYKAMCTPALIWSEMEKAGVPDIQGVWCSEAASSHWFTIVSIKQRYPGHARQAGLLATACHSGAHFGRYVIVVDEDIDPSNLSDVLWAVATRSDPERSIEIIRRCWSSPLDPAIGRGTAYMNSRAVIDACRPYEWKDEFPTVVDISPELRQKTVEKWGHLLNLNKSIG